MDLGFKPRLIESEPLGDRLVVGLTASRGERPTHTFEHTLHGLARNKRAEKRRHACHQAQDAAGDSRLLELPHVRQHPNNLGRGACRYSRVRWPATDRFGAQSAG